MQRGDSSSLAFSPPMNQRHVLVEVLDMDKWVIGLGTTSNPAEEWPSLVWVVSTGEQVLPHALLHIECLGTVQTSEGFVNLRLVHSMSYFEVLPHPLP